MALPTSEREKILRSIGAWPVDDQLTLAQIIRQHAAQCISAARQTTESLNAGRSTWDALSGIASNRRTPPIDEKVATLNRQANRDEPWSVEP